jgi:ABC-type multidrug transport system ATPase subunit
MNGGEVDIATFGRITSYVEQEDALIGSLTVKETLKFAADLSLPGCVLRLEIELEKWANRMAPH